MGQIARGSYSVLTTFVRDDRRKGIYGRPSVMLSSSPLRGDSIQPFLIGFLILNIYLDRLSHHDAQLPGTLRTFAAIVRLGSLRGAMASAYQKHRDLVDVLLDARAEFGSYNQSCVYV